MEEDEAQVEAMREEGRRIVMEAVAQYRPVAMVAACSGGDDSAVVAHFAHAEFHAGVLHCDTGIGLQPTRRHLQALAARFGWGLTVEEARPEGRPAKARDEDLPQGGWADGTTAYEEYVLNFGFAGPAQHGRMYQRLKQRPLRRHVRRLKEGTPRGSRVLILSGVRHDESAIRAGYRRAVMQDPKEQAHVWVNPFYWRTKADFALYRAEFGIADNPVKPRVGLSGDCMCGAFAHGASERHLARGVDPQFCDDLDALEARVRARGLDWPWGHEPPRWHRQARAGQGFLFDSHAEPRFLPLCVGCHRRPAGSQSPPPT